MEHVWERVWEHMKGTWERVRERVGEHGNAMGTPWEQPKGGGISAGLGVHSLGLHREQPSRVAERICWACASCTCMGTTRMIPCRRSGMDMGTKLCTG